MEIVKIFKALSDPTRLEIVMILQNGERCACDLLENVTCVQSTLSHHLKILVDAQVINARRESKWTHYSINSECVAAFCDFGSMMKDSLEKESKPSCGCVGEE